jgi:hypothetical protein
MRCYGLIGQTKELRRRTLNKSAVQAAALLLDFSIERFTNVSDGYT